MLTGMVVQVAGEPPPLVLPGPVELSQHLVALTLGLGAGSCIPLKPVQQALALIDQRLHPLRLQSSLTHHAAGVVQLRRKDLKAAIDSAPVELQEDQRSIPKGRELRADAMAWMPFEPTIVTPEIQ